MDLGAYANIGEKEFEEIVKRNNIEVPRLRGYRLMINEEKVDLNSLWTEEDDAECCKDLCCNDPFWYPNANMSTFSALTDWYVKYYLLPDEKGIRWDRIHGWKRRVLKTYIHNEKKRRIKQYEIFNKYVGRKDILYIHSRIGGGNWPYYYEQVIHQPWFIEKIDDSYDCTYCDIYAKIDIGGII